MAQSDSGQTGEVVANLAAGRVVIAVVKDAMLVGTVENPIEAQTLPPTPVQLTSERFGVYLGPVDWWSPPSEREIAELNQEIPRLHTYAVATPPHLGQSQGGDEPSDIEITGQSLQQRLNELAQSLHSPLNLPPDKPFAQLIVADYFAGYGPEVWQLAYSADQEEREDSFWTTRIEGPRYLQFWPPEKGQPRTLVEFRYPPEDPSPTLLQLLQQKDPRVERVIQSDPAMADVAQHFLDGTSNKVRAADATQFLQAVLDATAPLHAREIIGILHPETGFSWILAPAPEEPIHRENRPAGAPTLESSAPPAPAPPAPAPQTPAPRTH
ncbi:MAG: hypothetical protein KGL75_08975 [Acidobacteriota bacterium]|nr:hypothetical protein [Acidobacteriota bacterium]